MLQLSTLMFDVFLLKALRVLDRTWFPIKTTVLNIGTWTLGISIYIYDDNIYLSIYIMHMFGNVSRDSREAFI